MEHHVATCPLDPRRPRPHYQHEHRRQLSQAPAAVGQIVNVGSDEEVTIGALAELVRQQVGSRSEITFVPYDVAYARGFEDMQRRVPDLSKLQRIVNDRPRTPLVQILAAIIADVRSRPAGAEPTRASAITAP